MAGQDYKSYRDYYNDGIAKIIEEYKIRYDRIIVHPNAEEKIWNEYRRFNYLCKHRYMKHSDHLIDRHKVTACYIYAIVKARVLTSEISIEKGDDTNLLLNENLAYTFGFSLLRSLVLNIAHEYEAKSSEEENSIKKIIQIFDGDIELPSCSHGNYKDNFLSQLYFTWRESSYNILSLAESLFLIESYNMAKNGVPEYLLLG